MYSADRGGEGGAAKYKPRRALRVFLIEWGEHLENGIKG